MGNDKKPSINKPGEHKWYHWAQKDFEKDLATIANEKPPTLDASPGAMTPTPSTSKGNFGSKPIEDKKETKKSTSRKGGLPSYEESYTPEVAKIWEAKGGTGGTKEGAKAAYIKAAKRWNVAKYGTDEPSKKASKFTGGSLSRLAEQARPVKVESKGPDMDVAGLKYDQGRMEIGDSGPGWNYTRVQDVKAPDQSRKQERLTRKVEKTQKRITKAGEKGFVAEKGRLESKLGGLQKRQKKLDPTDDASRQSMSKTVASAFSSNPLIGGGGGTPATSGGPTATSGGSESKKFTGHPQHQEDQPQHQEDQNLKNLQVIR